MLQSNFFLDRRTSDETFLSFSIVEDDISVVLDERDIARYEKRAIVVNELWPSQEIPSSRLWMPYLK